MSIETINVPWYPSLESLIQDIKYPGFDRSNHSAFRRLSESEASALASDYSAAYEARVSVIKGDREDSFSLSLSGKEFRGELYCTDRGADIWTTALIAPSGRVFVRHFGDSDSMAAFLAAEVR